MLKADIDDPRPRRPTRWSLQDPKFDREAHRGSLRRMKASPVRPLEALRTRRIVDTVAVRDEDFVRELTGLYTEAFVVQGVQLGGDGMLEMKFVTRSDRRIWSVVLPLPSVRVLKPWLYLPPTDAADSVNMFATFLDEEILTTAIYVARGRKIAEVTRVELAPYGLRRQDNGEHERLAEAAARGGWDGREGSGDLQ